MGSSFLSNVAFYVGLLGSATGLVLVFRSWIAKHANRWAKARITEVVMPLLTNDTRTVANYAHDAADSAEKAHLAATEARSAAFEARDAALDSRDTLFRLVREGKSIGDNHDRSA